MTRKDYNRCVELWADDVYNFAMHCHHNESDCQDAVQEAFAALWKNLDNVQMAKGKSFLLSVTYRQLMMTMRSQKTAEHALDKLPRQDTEYHPCENIDLKEALQQAMQQLPETQKAILQLRDIDGYSYKEITKILNISEQQVQVYLFRARVAMRKQLNKNDF
ncbi:MAG: sigma-70 family RNA polymerase sigma factor [Bacteroidales bacterium]|nr:sigma-70 family RNA polymerase sigma factor [Bacteroidales bacterium]